MGGKGTSQTWQSSDGSGAIAFAGISASDLALYYAQQGNYEASAKLNSLAAAEAAGMLHHAAQDADQGAQKHFPLVYHNILIQRIPKRFYFLHDDTSC